MARIIYPGSFPEQRTLLASIKAKHTADGAGSVLTVFLTQQVIDLNDDTIDGNSANTLHLQASEFSKQSELFSQSRNLLFKNVFEALRASVQFLKSFYKPGTQALGDWGITVDNGGRIAYPPEFTGRAALFATFKQKHDTYAPPATVSPLTPFLTEHGISMTDLATLTGNAANNHNSFLTASQNGENATEQRDLLWDPVNVNLHKIGDYLKNLFVTNPKKLGDWGFTVDHSPRAPKERTSKVLPGDQVTITSVVIGGTFTNIGTVKLDVYQGKTTVGKPTSVAAGGTLGMPKGFSTITVMNTSTDVTGKFKVLVHK